VAYDAASGQEVFRTPFPDGVTSLQAAGRYLVGDDGSTGELVILD
jgi:hypothetical protein